MHPNIQHVIFAVCNEPYCVWGWDIKDRNIDFIERIDEKYFEYICETHLDHLEAEGTAHRAAIAIRANYHLALETLFSLIGAMFQAPDCVPAWVLKASTSQVRSFIDAIRKGYAQFPVKLISETSEYGFEQISKFIVSHTTWGAANGDDTAENLAGLLHRLSHDFLDEYAIKEYNSIKHGFRARAGGFQLAMGIEHEYGVSPPAEEMKYVGGSKFGTSFYSAEVIDSATSNKSDPNFRLRRNALNWLPEMTAGRLWLTAMLIKNMKSMLLVLNGRQAGTVQFFRPADVQDYNRPWSKSVGITSSNMDTTISEGDIFHATKHELREKLKAMKVGS
ncbi:MAG: hypothetical protein ACTHPD_15610 [Rhizomicrobium sp.]